MEIQSAFNTGVQGFQQAQEDANQAAINIVETTTHNAESFSAESADVNVEAPASESKSTPNLNQEIVNLKVAEFQAKASANVIQTADETLGTLLDVTA